MKNFKNLLTAITILFAYAFSYANQQVFFQENFSNGLTNWKTVDVDNRTVHSEMVQTLQSIGVTLTGGKMSWVSGKVSSNPDNYMALSTSYYNPAGRADDWLI